MPRKRFTHVKSLPAETVSFPPNPTLILFEPLVFKICVSCLVDKTPYWREGWANSIVLCNACGIRYKKYKKYCSTCRCVPRKFTKTSVQCPKCFKRL